MKPDFWPTWKVYGPPEKNSGAMPVWSGLKQAVTIPGSMLMNRTYVMAIPFRPFSGKDAAPILIYITSRGRTGGSGSSWPGQFMTRGRWVQAWMRSGAATKLRCGFSGNTGSEGPVLG